MGINLSSINYYSSQLPFVDEFKSSKNWITQSDTKWNTNKTHLLDLDSDGWVKSLPTKTKQAGYSKVATLLFRGHGAYLPGRYVVLYEGEGSIEYGFDAVKNEALSTPGRDVLEVNPSKTGIFLSITETDLNQTGNYIRNIQVIPEAEESNIQNIDFNSEFIDKIQPFNTLRFMDWMKTNNSQQTNWEDRPKVEDARYSEIGVPVEVMVELANQTNTDPWFTMPHMATDEYITNFARYVEDNLNPNLQVYVEYSNEVWNPQFSQHNWASQQAQQTWSNSDLNALDWYGMRTTEVVQLWEEAFDRESQRIIGVMGAQAANSRAGQNLLDYRWSNNSLSHSDTGIDAIAIAPYFGRYLGDPKNYKEVKQWTKDPDGGLDKLFRELNQGGVLKNSPEGGALGQTSRNIESYVQLADRENLELISYEGGHHLSGIRGVQNDQSITDLFLAANQNPRMGRTYTNYLKQWSDLGGDLFVHYNDIRTSNKWGSWGALESVYQQSSPKYDAIVDFAQRQPVFAPSSPINSPDTGSRIIGEVGEVSQFDHQSQTITFNNSYSNPVIFALPLSYGGGDPATVRITDLQSNNFTAFLQEPEYKNKKHLQETFSYIVLESGSWQLSNGSLLEVGTSNVAQVNGRNRKFVNFDNKFDSNPVILSQVQTYNDREFVRTRQQNSSVNGFSVSLEEEEALKYSGHDTETVGWLAIEPGVGTESDFSYQAGHTGNSVTSGWHDIDLDLELESSPHFLASLASYNDDDPAGLRFREVNSTGIKVRIEEDRSLDPEGQHNPEVVDFLAISNVGDLAASPYI